MKCVYFLSFLYRYQAPTPQKKSQIKIYFLIESPSILCNVFSSFAKQSHHHYIGTTNIEYQEI